MISSIAKCMKPSRILLISVVAVLATLSPATAVEVEVPDALERLATILGSWEAERVEFLDPRGEVRKVSSAEAHNRAHLDGLVIAHVGRLHDPAIEVRGWYYWNSDREELRLATVSSDGRNDEFVGGWQGDDLVMVTEPRPSDQGRLFRLSHRNVSEDSFLETLEISTDGGRTWRISSRQMMRRVAAPAVAVDDRPSSAGAAVLARLDEYTGRWRAEDRRDRNGEPFHFEYDLRWFDEGRTILEMVIEQVWADRAVVLFEGFKGRQPSGTGVYYVAASPSGRAARGEVILEGGQLVTAYDGWGPGGEVVEIRDVFTPVVDNGTSFVSRTYLRQTPDAEWRQIGEDHWRRVAS